jgi:hypothetical protein
VSFETSFDSKQPKLEPKLDSALSETKRLFRLFRFYCIPKQRFSMFRLNPRNKQKANRNSLIWSIFWYFSGNLGIFRVFSVCFGLFRNSLFRLFRFYTETESFDVSIEPKLTEDREHIFFMKSKGCFGSFRLAF